MTSDKGRDLGLDVLRIVGIAAVVFGHVVAGPATHQWLYPWHVPLFFFLTGYFWSPGRTLGREVGSRWRSLMVPYLTWLVVVIIVYWFVASVLSAPSVDVVVRAIWGGSLAGGPFGAYWFVSVLFVTAVLYRSIERLPVPVHYAIALTGIVVATLLPGTLGRTPLAVGLAVPCLIFVLAGRTARVFERRVRHPALTGFGILVVCALVVGFAPISDVDLKAGQFGTPGVGIIVSIALSWGMVLVFSSLTVPRPAGPAVIALASIGIAVVLSHTVVIWALSLLHVAPIVALVAAMILPCAFALMIRRTTFSTLFVGAPRRVRPSGAMPSDTPAPLNPGSGAAVGS